MRFDRLLAVVLMAGSVASGQTRIDLGSQGKAVDFSAATTTKPVKTGVSLPGTCTTGEMYFKSDAVPGQNLYLCSSTNAWTQLTGGSGGGGAVWGAVTGTLSNQTDLASALSAKAASSHTHAASEVTSGIIAAARLGTGTPSSSTYLRGDGTWSAVAGGGGGGAANPAGSNGQIQINDGGVFGARPAGNGLMMDSLSISVDPTVVATLGGAQTISGSKTYTGILQVHGGGAVLDATLAIRSKPEKVVATAPAGSCEDGEVSIKSNGQRYVCVGGSWASGAVLNQAATEPTCNATNSGLLYLNTSANPNTLRLCGKDSSGAYAWATVPVSGW